MGVIDRLRRRDVSLPWLERIDTGEQLPLKSPHQLKDLLDFGAWPWDTPPPSGWLTSGRLVTPETAVGLPALFSVIAIGSNSYGQVTLPVYETAEVDGREQKRKRADAWQFDLLNKMPSSDLPGPFPWRAKLAANLFGFGNAYLEKIPLSNSSRPVGDLVVRDPRHITPVRKGGQVIYHDSETSPNRELTRRELIPFHGWSFGSDIQGVSPITAARLTVSSGLKRRSFENDFYTNGAWPGVVLKFPPNIERDEAIEWRKEWDADHRGQPHRTGVVGGGADIDTLPVSLEDAQFVESNRMTREDIAGIYGFPTVMLGDSSRAATEHDRMMFVTFGLGWVLKCIEDGLNSDADLFGGDLFCDHNADALLRADSRTRAQNHKDNRQAGWITLNEIREDENRPPLEGGDELQTTPVGGESNPGGGGSGNDNPKPDDDEDDDTP